MSWGRLTSPCFVLLPEMLLLLAASAVVHSKSVALWIIITMLPLIKILRRNSLLLPMAWVIHCWEGKIVRIQAGSRLLQPALLTFFHLVQYYPPTVNCQRPFMILKNPTVLIDLFIIASDDILWSGHSRCPIHEDRAPCLSLRPTYLFCINIFDNSVLSCLTTTQDLSLRTRAIY